MDIIKELHRQNAYLRKLIDNDKLGDANGTLSKEIQHNTHIINQLKLQN